MQEMFHARSVGFIFGITVILSGIGLFFVAQQYQNAHVVSAERDTVITAKQIQTPHPSPTVIPDQITTLAVTGDVLLARSVNQKMVSRNDFTWPFLKTFEKLRQADITFINLETPLIADCPPRDDGMIFCGDPKGVAGLQSAGVDVASIANNHIGNWGEDGVVETASLLTNSGIAVAGFEHPQVLEKNGIKFAFLGFNAVGKQPLVDNYSPELLIQRITDAKKLADVVIVQFHWGEEYRHEPTDFQERVAHEAIDAGADLVVGNHPHWVQPIEWYNGKLIVYSHGNFVFDQMWSEETRLGVVGWYTFRDKQLDRFEFLPVKIEDYGQPRWLEGSEGEWVKGVMDDNKKPIAL